MIKHFGLNHKNARITSIILLGAILILLASASSVYATQVLLIKEHHPAATFINTITGTDGYVPGANVLFHVHLNVTSDVTGSPLAISNLTITDTLPTGLTYVTGSQTSSSQFGAAPVFTVTGNILFWNFSSLGSIQTPVPAPGSFSPSNILYTATVAFNVTINSNVPDNTFLVNNGMANYYETLIGIASNSSPATTNTIWVARPVLNIVKTNPAKVENGSNFNYVLSITNTGHLDATGVVVQDILPAGVTVNGAASTNVAYGGFLSNSGSNVTWSSTSGAIGNLTGFVTITIPVTVNTAASSVIDNANIIAAPLATFINSNGNCTTTVIHPAIGLTKVASSPKIENGTSVTYTYNVTNTGNTALTVSLTDNKLGTINGSFVLAAGGFQVFTKTTTLTVTTTNTANATGVDQTGKSVTAIAGASVTVIHPAISLTKTASPTTPQTAPANFTYTYNVTNIGNVALSGVTVYDQTYNVLVLGPITLTVGQSATGTYGPVTFTAAGNYTNVANATGTDQNGAKVSAFANATVVVLPPPVQTTRTWGFWKTHTDFTTYIFQNQLHSFIAIDSNSAHAKNITTLAQLFGGFEADVAKTSTGAHRSTIDQDRIILLHQLLGAILNTAAFGTTVPAYNASMNLIQAGNAAYSSNNATFIIQVAGLLDTFNSSGDNVAFPAGLPDQGNATPQASIAIADVAYWDKL